MNRFLLLLLFLTPCWLQAQTQRVQLPNGWSLTPTGRSLPLGDFPLNMVVSPDNRRMAVTNNGQSKQSIQLLDVTGNDAKLLATTEIPKSWVGLRFSPDGKRVFASGGNDNRVMIYSTEGDKLTPIDSIALGKPWPNKIWVGGVETDRTGNTLYAVTKDDSALYVCDVQSKRVTQRIKLPAEAYTCLRNPRTDELYISLWGGASVLVYDTKQAKITDRIATGDHPNDMIIGGKNGRYLLTANANDNSVSIIDLTTRKVIETLNTALYPDAPAGSTPNGLALSPDQKKLLVANADNNCLAVFDVSKPGRSRSLGFVPTGWYPTSVKVVGKTVLVANGKGMSSLPNPKGPSPFKGRSDPGQYIGSMFKGTLSLFELPNEKQLTDLTRLTYANTPYSKEREKLAEGEANNPIPRQMGDTAPRQASPIKYVFYIIKENRTYDQVFGDMPGGNGDSSLCLFPEKITPNQHALAREFGLLDNFYVDAEVSADGHNWSTAAYAPDYVEKTWPTSYGGRGGAYDYEGSRATAYPKKGFIWDHAKRAGVSYRGYGEFAAYARKKGSALDGQFCHKYPDYDLRIKDIDRVEVWKRDFDSLVTANALPHLNTLRLGNNHTAGARIGQLTPVAMVADNDLAVGRFVEHISNSPIWKEAAIFILEDDAQNGADHVDAHRSPALVISPYAKRRHVEHTMYSTSAMLRTMELILGMPPMSQYDAGARPMFALFTNTPNVTPYKHIPANVDLDAKNTAMNEPARRSEKFDLRHADTLDDNEFNAVIWMAVRGEKSPVPAPRRGAWLRIVEADDDDK